MIKIKAEFDGIKITEELEENEFYDLNWYSILKESYESVD